MCFSWPHSASPSFNFGASYGYEKSQGGKVIRDPARVKGTGLSPLPAIPSAWTGGDFCASAPANEATSVPFALKRSNSDVADTLGGKRLAFEGPAGLPSSSPGPGTSGDPQFVLERGDLIYGLSDARKALYQTYRSQSPGHAVPSDVRNPTFINHAMSHVIDTLSTDARSHLHIEGDHGTDSRRHGSRGITARQRDQAGLSDAEIRAAFSKAYADLDIEEANGEDILDILCEHATDINEAQENFIGLIYRMCALAHKTDGRYDIPALQFREETAKLRHQMLHGAPPPASPSVKGSFSARISKLAIATLAVPGTRHQIHFALDGIDMQAVVRKTGASGNSHTAGELRAAHRLSREIEGRMHFYRDGKVCPAPWESDPALWNERSPKRLRNFSNVIEQTRQYLSTLPARSDSPVLSSDLEDD